MLSGQAGTPAVTKESHPDEELDKVPRGHGLGRPSLTWGLQGSFPGETLFQLRLEGVGVKQKAEASVPVSSAAERIHEKDGA